MKDNITCGSHIYKENAEIVDKINLSSCREVEEKFIEELKLLELYMQNPDFGVGEQTIGTELELSIVNNDSLTPAMLNQVLCDNIKQKYLQAELSKFCIEYNGQVLLANNQPLITMKNELEQVIAHINKTATSKFNSTVVPIGILPTLSLDDLSLESLTPTWRYQSIDKLLRSLRSNRDFLIDIDGEDPLELKWNNTVVEGVNSSFQVHLRVNPSDFNDYYNAAQLASAFVLAVSCNSPLLFGHKLWNETRIAIFEQTVNNHNIHPGEWQEQQRVSFGRGWVKDGVLGIFKEVCELFHPIFPAIRDNIKHNLQDTSNNSNTGPDLIHIAQHNSSVWPWNRPIYDPMHGGHFRIEMRYLPSGPTIADMIYNTGFMLGLTKAFSKNVSSIISELPFKYAQYNFYQAAQHGLDADCIWYNKSEKSLQERPIVELLDYMVDLAAEGLADLGVSDLEIRNMQNCIKHRLDTKLTGASWQREVFNQFISQHKLDKQEALQEMLKLYIANQDTHLPVSMWNSSI